MQNYSGKLIPGNELAKRKKDLIVEKIFREDIKPKLAIFQVGDDPASTLYVSMKAKFAEEVGINAEKIIYTSSVESGEVIENIKRYVGDRSVNGIMVQAPIPGRDLKDSLEIFNAINAEKDVDGLSYHSLGKLWQHKTFQDLVESGIYLSATPAGVLDCLLWIAATQNIVGHHELENLHYDRFNRLGDLLEGKSILVINRSNIVGKPLVALMQMFNATVTLAHSKTRDLKSQIKNFDIVLTGTGVDGLFTFKDFNSDQIVIDIGINNNNPDGKVRGDVNLDGIEEIHPDGLPYIAGVPGGVGPLTVANLLSNTFLSYSKGK